jgi:hypothetical protein
VRSPTTKSAVHREVLVLGGLALGLLVSGLLLLARSHRYFRDDGILSWPETTIERGAAHVESTRMLVRGAPEWGAGPALIDPRVLGSEASYRVTPTIDAHSVFFASRSAAVFRAKTMAAVAAICLTASAIAVWASLALR